MTVEFYRIRQPLFSWEDISKLQARDNRPLILAYDCIYNLLQRPIDMRAEDIQSNAEAVLAYLGTHLCQKIGDHIFDMQMEFKEGNNGKI